MTSLHSVVIGSRGSKLALWQSHWVKSRLEAASSDLEVKIQIIRTTGDEISSKPLPEIGGKGVFTQELEEALLSGHIDLAVHSLKDLPTVLPDGLEIGAVTPREDARDALLLSSHLRGSATSLGGLPARARVGTSSLRRASQLRHLRPDLEIVDLRGNVDTRLRKLDSGAYDALILAVAGLSRLDLASRIDAIIDIAEMLPAVGQGALGIECRGGDTRVLDLLASLEDRRTRLATKAERAVLNSLGGGCAVPIAAYGRIEEIEQRELLILDGVVADVAGNRLIRQQTTGDPEDATEQGKRLAGIMLALGAGDLLGDLRIGS